MKLNRISLTEHLAGLTLIGLISLSACNQTEETGFTRDIEGNIYETVRIGDRIWMKENLKTTILKDGSPIAEITNDTDWFQLETPAYCWYNNDSAGYKNLSGALYNYYTINSGKLCPDGWRVPTTDDYKNLLLTLDQKSDYSKHEVSGHAKTALLKLWGRDDISQNTATENGIAPQFYAGCRSYMGKFSMMGIIGYYGSSSDEGSVAIRTVNESIYLRQANSPYIGVSVRCVKDR